MRKIENQRSTWKHKQTRTIRTKYWSHSNQSPICVMWYISITTTYDVWCANKSQCFFTSKTIKWVHLYFIFYCFSLEIWIRWVWWECARFFYWFTMEQSWLYFLYSILLYWKGQHNIWKYGSHDKICCSATKNGYILLLILF